MMVIGDRVAEMVTAVISDSTSDADGMLSGHKKSVWNVEYVEQWNASAMLSTWKYKACNIA